MPGKALTLNPSPSGRGTLTTRGLLRLSSLPSGGFLLGHLATSAPRHVGRGLNGKALWLPESWFLPLSLRERGPGGEGGPECRKSAFTPQPLAPLHVQGDSSKHPMVWATYVRATWYVAPTKIRM